MKYNKNIRNLFADNLNQMWFNAQKMEREERKNTIAYIIQLNKYSSSFIDYSAKFFLAGLIDKSNCWYNNLGYSTPVKEFMELGWYKEEGKKIDGSPMYVLDYNKVMQ